MGGPMARADANRALVSGDEQPVPHGREAQAEEGSRFGQAGDHNDRSDAKVSATGGP